MAPRVATAPPARRAAPPPAAPDPMPSVYEEVWGVVVNVDPQFSPPGPREDDQTFIKRLVRAVSTMPEETWNALSEEAQAWYDQGAQEFKSGQTVTAPDGFYPDAEAGADDAGEGEPEAEAEPEPAPAPVAAKRSPGAALMEYNAKKKAEKEAAAAAAAGGVPAAAPARGRARTAAPAPAPAPAPRRAASPAAPAPAPRRGAPAPAPARAAPARQAPAAAAAAVDRGPSMVGCMREFIIGELAAGRQVGGAEVAAHIESLGMTPTHSTIAGTLTFTKNTVEAIKSMGHWR